jgi:hypothetical protein
VTGAVWNVKPLTLLRRGSDSGGKCGLIRRDTLDFQRPRTLEVGRQLLVVRHLLDGQLQRRVGVPDPPAVVRRGPDQRHTGGVGVRLAGPLDALRDELVRHIGRQHERHLLDAARLRLKLRGEQANDLRFL